MPFGQPLLVYKLVLEQVFQASSETILISLALHLCIILAKRRCWDCHCDLTQVLTQTQDREHEAACLYVWQAVLIHSSTAAEKHTCLLQVDKADGCRRHLVLKGSGLLLAPLSQPIELLACLVQPRHPA